MANIGDTDNVQYGRATVLVNGLMEPKPRSWVAFQRSADGVEPSAAEDSLYALNCLQFKRDSYLERYSVEIPTQALLKSLPQVCRNMIHIPDCCQRVFFELGEDILDQRIEDEWRGNELFWEPFLRAEYVFWPMQTSEGYFVTAIFHKRRGMIDDPDFDADANPDDSVPQIPGPYNIIDAWSIVDTERGQGAQEREALVRDRLQQILSQDSIMFLANAYKDRPVILNGSPTRQGMPWVPQYNNDYGWSSGIRAFALIRQLVQRVLEYHIAEMEYSDDFFRESTCGWLNVDQVRHEMMGISAICAVNDMRWNARLSIECIKRLYTFEPEPRDELFDADMLRPDDTHMRIHTPIPF
ncbi:hypothetical protein F4808DRAFT_463141 [Astrocystis sublimbata]|nr:hypothetical protein F4808DRAFT_463141 [Astrocystis sublimbata]